MLCGLQARTSRTPAISHAIADTVQLLLCTLLDSNFYVSWSALGLPPHYHLDVPFLDETSAECNRSFVSVEKVDLRL